MKEIDDHPMRFPRRQAGRTEEMKALIEKAKAEGNTVLVIGKDSPRPELLGAAMPPIGDPEIDRALDFAAAFPTLLMGHDTLAPIIVGNTPLSTETPLWVQSYIEAREKAKSDLNQE